MVSLSEHDSVPVDVRRISDSLITQLTKKAPHEFYTIKSLDLHAADDSPRFGKIQKIEGLATSVRFLNTLDLSFNKIRKIEGLATLVHLVNLNLSNNSISKIENLFSLTNLERLDLSGNSIIRIPQAMSKLKSLISLNLARNKIAVVQDLSALIPLERLSILHLDENPVSSLFYMAPFAIHHLRSLTILNGYEIVNADREEASLCFMRDEDFSSLEAGIHRAVSSAQDGAAIASLKMTLAEAKKRTLECVAAIRQNREEHAVGAAGESFEGGEEDGVGTPVDAAKPSPRHRTGSIQQTYPVVRQPTERSLLSHSADETIYDFDRVFLRESDSEALCATSAHAQPARVDYNHHQIFVALEERDRLRRELSSSERERKFLAAELDKVKLSLERAEAAGADAVSLARRRDLEVASKEAELQQKLRDARSLAESHRLHSLALAAGVKQLQARVAELTRSATEANVSTLSEAASLREKVRSIQLNNDRLSRELVSRNSDLYNKTVHICDLENKLSDLSRVDPASDSRKAAVTVAAMPPFTCWSEVKTTAAFSSSDKGTKTYLDEEDSVSSTPLKSSVPVQVSSELTEDGVASSSERLQAVAAEALASILFEELSLITTNSSSRGDNVDSVVADAEDVNTMENLKKGCVRAAIRILATKNQGDLAVISDDFDLEPNAPRMKSINKLVLEARRDLSKTEEKSTRDLNNILKAMQSEANVLEDDIQRKRIALGDLRERYEETKMRTQSCEEDLVVLHGELLSKRDELKKMGEEISLSQRLLDDRQGVLLDLRKRSEKDHQEALAARSRLKDVQAQVRNAERSLDSTSRLVAAEEEKLARIKLGAEQQLLALQEDLTIIQKNFRVKEKEITGLDAQKRAMEDEMSSMQRSSKSLERACVHTQQQLQQVKAAVEVTMAEARMAEKQLRELKQECQEQEHTLDALRILEKDLEGEKDRLAIEVERWRQIEEETRLAAESQKLLLETDYKTVDEVHRKILHLRDQEVELSEKCGALKSSIHSLQSVDDKLRRDLDRARELKSDDESVIRSLRLQREALENEAHHLAEDLRVLQEKVSLERGTLSNTEVSLATKTLELKKLCDDRAAVERRVIDGNRLVEELVSRLSDERRNVHATKEEAARIVSLVDEETQKLETCRRERAQLLDTLEGAKEQANALQMDVNELKAQSIEARREKDIIGREVARIRDDCRAERRRAESSSSAADEAEKKLQVAVADLARTELLLSRAREQLAGEEKRVAEQRRLLKLATNELEDIESSISRSRLKVYEAQSGTALETARVRRDSAEAFNAMQTAWRSPSSLDPSGPVRESAKAAVLTHNRDDMVEAIEVLSNTLNRTSSTKEDENANAASDSWRRRSSEYERDAADIMSLQREVERLREESDALLGSRS